MSSGVPRALSLRLKYTSAGSWQLGSTEKTAVSSCDDAVRLVTRQVMLVQLGLLSPLHDSRLICARTEADFKKENDYIAPQESNVDGLPVKQTTETRKNSAFILDNPSML